MNLVLISKSMDEVGHHCLNIGAGEDTKQGQAKAEDEGGHAVWAAYHH